MFKAPLALFQRGTEPVNLDLYLRLSFSGRTPYASVISARAPNTRIAEPLT